MNPRERILATTALVAVLAGGLFLIVYQFYWSPLHKKNETIDALRADIDKQTVTVREMEAQRRKLERWRLMSLPGDENFAGVEYEKFLTKMLQESGFTDTIVTPQKSDPKAFGTTGGPKGPGIATKMPFRASGSAPITAVVEMLKRFYEAGLLHQIRTLSIQRPVTITGQRNANQLDVTMTIEALIVPVVSPPGSSPPVLTLKRPLIPAVDPRLMTLAAVGNLLRGPGASAFAYIPGVPSPTTLGPNLLARYTAYPDQYADIGKVDIFMGPVRSQERPVPNVDVSEFVRVTDITKSGNVAAATVYDVYDNKSDKILEEDGKINPAWNSIRIRDAEGNVVTRGSVVKIGDRDLLLKLDGKHYAVHVGRSVQEAKRRPLSKEALLKDWGISEEAAAPEAEVQTKTTQPRDKSRFNKTKK